MASPRKPGLEALGQRTLVMGVLNVTPDSFSDGGRHSALSVAVERALEMREQGADVIDIGGESTRPGSDPVPEEEELRRVVPVLEALHQRGVRGLSIDTTKATVAERAVELGVDIINDISGLSFDPLMTKVVADSGAYLIVGHTRGSPKLMQKGIISYPEGVTKAVMNALAAMVDDAESAGINRQKVLVDPGFGFGKTVEHNCQLLRELKQFRKLGSPVVVGTSRKTFLGQLTGRSVKDRDFATASSVALAIAHGADVVRVHDVASMVDVVRVADAIVRDAKIDPGFDGR